MPRPPTQPEGFYSPRSAFRRVAWKPQRDGGFLLVFDDDRVQLYANYASQLPWAAEKTHATRSWRRFFGSWRFEISDIAKQVRRYRAKQDAARARGAEPCVRPGMEARAKFLETVDPAHLRQVTRYQLRTFQLYNAIRRCPGLFDLVCEHGETPDLAGGGALAYALANLPLLLNPRPMQPLRTARRLLRRKRKDIAIALGFPAETAAIATRVLGRIPTLELWPDTIRAIRTALIRGDTHTRKLLAHAGRINHAAAKLVEDPYMVERLTAPLLHEIGRVEDFQEAVVLFRLVEDTVGMLDRRGIRVLTLRTVEELCALHAAEVARAPCCAGVMANDRRAFGAAWDAGEVPGGAGPGRLRGRGGCDDLGWGGPTLELPPAPVPELPGEIEYVSSSQDALDLEGAQMHNCVSGYARRVAQGDCFIYRVLTPERCTLAIDLGPHGQFRIMQIRTLRNGPVQRSTERIVEQWLRAHDDPVGVERVRALIVRRAPEQLPSYVAAGNEAAYQGEEYPF